MSSATSSATPGPAAGKNQPPAYDTHSLFSAVAQQSAKEIVRNSEMKTFFVSILVRAGIQGSKIGMSKADLPEHVIDGIADQFTVAWELVKTGNKLTPAGLSRILTEKALGVAKITTGDQRVQCGISVAVAAIGVLKSAGALAAAKATFGAGAGLVLIEVAGLMQGVYDMDRTCNISGAVRQKVEEKTTPFFMWMHREIYQLYRVPGL